MKVFKINDIIDNLYYRFGKYEEKLDVPKPRITYIDDNDIIYHSDFYKTEIQKHYANNEIRIRTEIMPSEYNVVSVYYKKYNGEYELLFNSYETRRLRTSYDAHSIQVYQNQNKEYVIFKNDNIYDNLYAFLYYDKNKVFNDGMKTTEFKNFFLEDIDISKIIRCKDGLMSMPAIYLEDTDQYKFTFNFDLGTNVFFNSIFFCVDDKENLVIFKKNKFPIDHIKVTDTCDIKQFEIYINA